MAVDAKVNLDDNALFRHRDLLELRDLSEEDPLEVEAGENDLNYVRLDGNVGCMVNGAGLAMATMDIIKLSGGERQRVSIARAVLHDPRILVLDEATSSVDTETERKIQQAMDRLVAGRTVFAIAHRLSTLHKASRLFVMEDGKLAECGTHKELLARPDGIYRRLYELQRELQ